MQVTHLLGVQREEIGRMNQYHVRSWAFVIERNDEADEAGKNQDWEENLQHAFGTLCRIGLPGSLAGESKG